MIETDESRFLEVDWVKYNVKLIFRKLKISNSSEWIVTFLFYLFDKCNLKQYFCFRLLSFHACLM